MLLVLVVSAVELLAVWTGASEELLVAFRTKGAATNAFAS